ncbi:MAG: hypothetical protein KIH69_021860 [Anaerolineae bacterium]|nr:hypothetical protein [Anaerolineae bacterium]
MKKLYVVGTICLSLLSFGCRSQSATPGAGLEASRIGVPVAVGLPTPGPGTPTFVVTSTPAPNTASSRSASPVDARVAAKASQAVKALKDKDFAALSTMAYPGRGVCFSPTVQMMPNSVCLQPSALPEYLDGSKRAQVLNWGNSRGSAVRLSVNDYFERYLNSRDFSAANAVQTPNPREARGPVKSNIARFYPNCAAVEFYVPGTGSNDWRAISMVFQPYRGDWRLIAIVSDEA